jgi:hypothetical protein
MAEVNTDPLEKICVTRYPEILYVSRPIMDPKTMTIAKSNHVRSEYEM